MRRQGVTVDVVRAVDHDIATGVWPDMTEHGWERDEWPAIFEQVMAADILVLLHADLARREVVGLHPGRSSACTATRHLLNDAGQYAYYGRVGGCLVTGNEDGVKHCAMNILYSLQHLGYVDPAPGRRRLDRRGRPRPVLPRPGLGRPRERLHQPQHHVHDLEPAAPRPHAQGRRRHPRPRQPALRVGRRLPLRLPPTPSTAEPVTRRRGPRPGERPTAAR